MALRTYCSGVPHQLLWVLSGKIVKTERYRTFQLCNGKHWQTHDLDKLHPRKVNTLDLSGKGSEAFAPNIPKIPRSCFTPNWFSANVTKMARKSQGQINGDIQLAFAV